MRAADVLLVIGLWIRPPSIPLAGWCLLTAAIFHPASGDPSRIVNLLENLTKAGLFLMLAEYGSPSTSCGRPRTRSRPRPSDGDAGRPGTPMDRIAASGRAGAPEDRALSAAALGMSIRMRDFGSAAPVRLRKSAEEG